MSEVDQALDNKGSSVEKDASPESVDYADYWDSYAAVHSERAEIADVNSRYVQRVSGTIESGRMMRNEQYMEDDFSQLERWYSKLGPTNQLEGAEPVLTRAAELARRYAEWKGLNSAERPGARLLQAEMLSDAARASQVPERKAELRKAATESALEAYKEVNDLFAEGADELDDEFIDRLARERQKAILTGFDIEFEGIFEDLQAMRGETGVPVSDYRRAEGRYQELLHHMNTAVSELLRDGKLDIGFKFEAVSLLGLRYSALANEQIENVFSRQAVKREDDPRLGFKRKGYPSLAHDIVVRQWHQQTKTYGRASLQLKAGTQEAEDKSGNAKKYDRSVTVVRPTERLGEGELRRVAQGIERELYALSTGADITPVRSVDHFMNQILSQASDQK